MQDSANLIWVRFSLRPRANRLELSAPANPYSEPDLPMLLTDTVTQACACNSLSHRSRYQVRVSVIFYVCI